MFLSNPFKIRRALPAPFTLIRTSTTPGLAGLKIVDTFPAKFLTEDRTHFLQAIMYRADAMRARPFILIVREAQTIIIFHTFSCAFSSIFRVGIIIAKARGAISIHIQRHFASDDPLCHQLANAARAAIAVERHARRHPHAAHARHRSKHGLAIRSVRAGMA